jgi:hypothetical protein
MAGNASEHKKKSQKLYLMTHHSSGRTKREKKISETEAATGG